MTKPPRLLLAQFNRAFEHHHLYANPYQEALEDFCVQVKKFCDEYGIDITIKSSTTWDAALACDVSVVWGEFRDQSDLAMYKVVVPEHRFATTVVNNGDHFSFSDYVVFAWG